MATSSMDSTVVSSLPTRRRLTIPELLASRQLEGAPRHRRTSRVNSLLFSSAIAWNTCRMQNMIMAVGPGTPAAVAAIQNEESSDEENDNDREGEEKDSEESDDDTEESGNANRTELRSGVNEQGSIDARDPRHLALAQRVFLELMEEDDEDEESESDEEISHGNYTSSIRHGGCINTATWLTSPWRLSLPGHDSSVMAVDSQECPTQLITSGDDRLVKFWDVRHAMGTTSPLPSGRYVHCPFADISECSPYDWKQHEKNGFPLAGSVIPLATLRTDHHGNIFHVTPVDHQPGKVVTCGADGYLRMEDVHQSSGSSTIIVSPEYGHGDLSDVLPAGLLSMRSGMCFSHHFLNANTGLLCSERGLTRFDVRLPPREQSARSLLGNDKSCKCCAIWSASSASASVDDMDSAYVFAGGASADVALYDLRMTDGSSSKVVQRYRPSGLSAGSQVSVSGLDISKDKRELLVSYENDQIFTFPVFPHTLSAAGPTVDELGEYCSKYDESGEDKSVLNELAAYGGHLNRFTFLKNAKYAGPRDEYICTGSDSGHAWIYERASGTVASFLSADQSTCNGVVPHPTLPFFLTYGIDSTAKLWRATNPVDGDADDSPLGRARQCHRHPYETSSLVKNWGYVKSTAASITSREDEVTDGLTIYPDQFPIADDTMGNSALGGILFRRRMFGLRGTRGTSIGNDLRELPNILQQNVFACVTATEEGEPEPVVSGLGDLCRRVSTIRLRHQADQRGLIWNADVPWMLAPRERYIGMELAKVPKSSDRTSKCEHTSYGNPLDLVPEPCDWIPYDMQMSKHPRPCGPRFNTVDYANFYWEQYSQFYPGDGTFPCKHAHSPWVHCSEDETLCSDPDRLSQGLDDLVQYESDHAWKLLVDTAVALKEGGNAALGAGSEMEAARRYDRAIKYCAVGLLVHPNANQDFLDRANHKWYPLRKTLVTTRLNLCKVLLDFDPRGAREQAMQALQDLAPFCSEKGKVVVGKKHGVVHNQDEPISTYQETKELQAKVYFRLGSVNLKVGDYEEAVVNFEKSVKATKEASKPPDNTVLRRLAEAKKEKARKSKRQKKKFKRMLAQEALEDDGENTSGRNGGS